MEVRFQGEYQGMMSNRRVHKAISKLLRLKMSGELGDMIRKLPLQDMVETQVGDHIYSGNGRMNVGSSSIPVTIRVREVLGSPRFFLEAPKVGMSVECPFEIDRVIADVWTAIQKTSN